jgi:hypothetical protein
MKTPPTPNRGLALLAILLLALPACAPTVYLLDRQTVLEEEAAGEWPSLEASIQKQAKASAPTEYPTVEQSAAKRRRYSTLNAESTIESAPGKKTTQQ